MSYSNSRKSTSERSNQSGMFYFGKQNYYWMFAGLALIILGLILMAGGGSDDPHVYNEEELFSFRRITLAPIIMVIGFIFEVVAIMRKPKSNA
jgi:uncharacterized membrane protein